MEHFYQNLNGENWFTYPNLYKEMVNKCPIDGVSHFVEVGSWKGKSASFMGVEIVNSKKKIKFDCVDCWIHDEIYNQFVKNIEPLKYVINFFREHSIKATTRYENNSLDFVFIDAFHTYDAVTEDIIYWYPKVKENGIIAGHDFWIDTHPEYIPDVNKAVIRLFKDDFISTEEGCWIHAKTKKNIKSII